MPEADRSASPPSSTRPPEGVDVGLNFGHVVSFLCGAIVPESDRSALLEFDLSSAVLWAVAAADGSEAVAGGDPCFEVFIVDCAPIGEDGYLHSTIALTGVKEEPDPPDPRGSQFLAANLPSASL